MRVLSLSLLFFTAAACESQQRGPALPIATFGYDRSQAMDLTVRASGVREGVTINELSYASPRGGRATGFLFVPQGTGPFAGIIVQHGMPSRASDMTPQAVEIARRGAVVIAIDAPWARTGEVIHWDSRDSANQVQLIVDLQRAVDILVARNDVDSARLAYVGVSYGGAMGGLFAGIERRLTTYVLRVGDGGLISHFTGAEDPPVPPGISADQWRRWRAAMEPIEPIRFVGQAAPASIYFQSGSTDRLVPPADALAYHAAAGEPKKVSWYQAGHGLNQQAGHDMYAWLSEKVGLK
jgi:uncharacterized protein